MSVLHKPQISNLVNKSLWRRVFKGVQRSHIHKSRGHIFCVAHPNSTLCCLTLLQCSWNQCQLQQCFKINGSCCSSCAYMWIQRKKVMTSFRCICYTLNPIAKMPFPFLATLQQHHLFSLAWDVSHIHTLESFFLELSSKVSQQAILAFQAPNFE